MWPHVVRMSASTNFTLFESGTRGETRLVSDHDFLLLLLGAVRVQFGYSYMGDGGGYVVFTRELDAAFCYG